MGIGSRERLDSQQKWDDRGHDEEGVGTTIHNRIARWWVGEGDRRNIRTAGGSGEPKAAPVASTSIPRTTSVTIKTTRPGPSSADMSGLAFASRSRFNNRLGESTKTDSCKRIGKKRLGVGNNEETLSDKGTGNGYGIYPLHGHGQCANADVCSYTLIAMETDHFPQEWPKQPPPSYLPSTLSLPHAIFLSSSCSQR